MYCDLLSSENYISFNIKLAKITNLETAIYWAILLNIIRKVLKKQKFNEKGFFKLDRNYITDQTTLSLDAQYNSDSVLNTLGVLEADPDDKDQVRVNLELMTSILIDDDVKQLSGLVQKVKKDKTTAAKNKTEAIKSTMKAGIIEPDVELLESLKDWVDAIYANKNFLTKKVIETFQTTIKKYSDNKQVQLKIIELATIHAYKDAAWAINLFEKDYKKAGLLNIVDAQNNKQVKVGTITF